MYMYRKVDLKIETNQTLYKTTLGRNKNLINLLFVYHKI